MTVRQFINVNKRKVKIMQFDLETLYENLMAHPHTINGSFLSENITVESEDDPNSPMTIDLSDGERITIVEVNNEFPESGIVVCTDDNGDQIMVQFFKPASFSEL